jgi:hypothetical protein
MILQAPDRLQLQPVKTAEAVRAQRELAEQRQTFARVFGGNAKSSSSEQAVVLHFGSQALSLARGQAEESDSAEAEGRPSESGQGDAESQPEAEPAGQLSQSPSAVSPFAPRLSAEDGKRVDELRGRDREVRTHEQAHETAGGQLAGSVHLEYELGPDGERYAVGGEVPIDVSPVAGDPEATLRKMEVVARAANAPASPSGADRGVAAQAARLSQQARAQLAAARYAQAQALA